MQVECPHCQTVFKVTEAQLHIADGMVRCGLCHVVFDAVPDSDAQTNESSQASQLEQGAEPSPVTEEVTRQNTTETHDEKNTTTMAGAAFDHAIEKKKEEFSSDDLFDGVQSKLIPDEYRIPELHKPYSIWRDMAWSLAILVLAISLFAEYAWFNRNQLITRPELTPWVAQLCIAVNCNVLDLRNANEIEMIARNIYSHPNVPAALMVSVSMINHAAFAQPYPAINIDFSDVRGEVVASRTFTPEQYLQINRNKIKLLSPGVTTDFHLEIQDPGPQAKTYEFNFL